MEGSRRQRLWGFARQTKDAYIPKLQSTVQSLTTPVRTPEIDEFGRLRLNQNTVLILFPTYTSANIYDDDAFPKTYDVHVHGWVMEPGTMTRKNRLILSLARQVVGSDSQTAMNQLANIDSVSSDDILVSLQSTVSDDQLLKKRLSNFMARSIAGATLEITIGSANGGDSLKQVTVVSDDNGHFKATVQVPYQPLVVRVEAVNDEQIFTMTEPMIVENDWLKIGVISDIDDTIKMTGVTGDKRALLRLLLFSNIHDWRLEEMIAWYQKFGPRCSFHYVLNLPWQLLPTIQEYVDAAMLPQGSFHLKQYTGNILGLLMEPLTLRKRISLNKILADFDQKKFICIGDLGEFDLEAYVDAAAQYPNQILTIYIRYVPDTLSDWDDTPIYREVRRLLREHNANVEITRKEHLVEPPVMENLIDLDTPVKPCKPEVLKGKPMKPAKPAHLAGERSAPELPQRPSETSISNLTPPPLPERPQPPQLPLRTPSTYDLLDLETTDPKGAHWVMRTRQALHKLKNSQTRLELFEDNDPEFYANAKKALDDHEEHIDVLEKVYPKNLRLPVGI